MKNKVNENSKVWLWTWEKGPTYIAGCWAHSKSRASVSSKGLGGRLHFLWRKEKGEKGVCNLGVAVQLDGTLMICEVATESMLLYGKIN